MTIRVTVAFAAAGSASAQDGVADVTEKSGEVSINLASNATIADALTQAGFDAAQMVAVAAVGVWGKVRPLTFVLRGGNISITSGRSQSGQACARRWINTEKTQNVISQSCATVKR
jgi:hypothetical protein